jgi:hypothetical protein
MQGSEWDKKDAKSQGYMSILYSVFWFYVFSVIRIASCVDLERNMNGVMTYFKLCSYKPSFHANSHC